MAHLPLFPVTGIIVFAVAIPIGLFVEWRKRREYQRRLQEWSNRPR